MSSSSPYLAPRGGPPGRSADSLADVLERVLDKGIVIAGDIRVELLDIELLTIRIRLLIASADKAAELGMAWWRHDPFYTGLAEGGAAAVGPGERPASVEGQGGSSLSTVDEEDPASSAEGGGAEERG